MKFLSLFIALIFATTIFSQNEEEITTEEFEGRIKYELVFENMSEDVKQYSSFMPKKMTIEVEGSKARIIMGEKAEENNVIITDSKTNTTLTLTKHIDTKIALLDEGNEEEIKNIDIEYFDEKKEIAGYECFKAAATIDGNKVIYYYTEELPSIKSNYVKNLKGYPMEIIIESSKYTMIQRVIEVKKTLVDDISLDIPEGYIPMTPKQMSKTYGIGM